MKKIFTMASFAIVFLLSSCSMMLSDFKSMSQDGPFTVDCYGDFVDSNDIDYDTKLLETKIVSSGNPEKYTAEAIPGFTFVRSEVTKTDSSCEVRNIYSRNTIYIKFDANSGIWAGNITSKTISGKFGSLLVKPNENDIINESYNFVAWSTTQDGSVITTPQVETTFPAENKTYYAIWEEKAGENANYTIQYLVECNSDSGYTELIDETYYKIAATETTTGKIGNFTTVTVSNIEKFQIVSESERGFELSPVTQQIIQPDNSTIVKVCLKRKAVTLTFLAADGKWADSTTAPIIVKGQYGKSFVSLTIPNPEKSQEALFPISNQPDLYSFAGWNTIGGKLPEKFPFSDTTYTAQYSQYAAYYTVEHLFEKADGTGYEINELLQPTEEILGQIIDINGNKVKTKAKAVKVEGFVTPGSIEQKLILKSPEKTVIQIKYDRKTVSVSYDPNGGAWSDSTKETLSVTGKYGTALTIPFSTNPEIELFTFLGWITKDSVTPVETQNLPVTFPSGDVNYIGKWEQTGAAYTIKYYYENAASDEEDKYELKPEESKILSGVLNTETKITAGDKNAPLKTGYLSPVITNTTIKDDDSAVVTVKYERASVTVTFKLSETGSKWKDSTAENKTSTGKIGAFLPAAFADTLKDPVCGDSKFLYVGWTVNKSSETVLTPSTYPEESTEYTTKWSQNAADFTIKTYYMKADGTYAAEPDSTRTETGEIGATTNVSGTYAGSEGYENATVTQKTIAASGTEVIVKFPRKKITYTFNAGDGKWSDTNKKTVSGLWGSTVTKPEDPSRDYWTFTGWTPEVDSTFDLIAKTYDAKWNPNITIGEPTLSGTSDISLTATVDGSVVECSVSVPYTDTWTYDWYVDNVKISRSENSSLYTTETLSAGYHTVLVIVYKDGDKVKFTKTKAVSIN